MKDKNAPDTIKRMRLVVAVRMLSCTSVKYWQADTNSGGMGQKTQPSHTLCTDATAKRERLHTSGR